MLTTLIAFLVVIGVLVFVHELGHLIAAKSVDIAVPRFSIGFGPRIAGFQWGETEYVISALPLGGYVRMAGMEDTSALEGGDELAQEPSDRDFDAKPLWARVWVVSAGVLMNFLFAIVVIAGVALVYGESINPTTRVAIVGQESLTGAAAPLAAIPVGAELSAVNGTPVENWNGPGQVRRGGRRAAFPGVHGRSGGSARPAVQRDRASAGAAADRAVFRASHR